MKNDDEMYRSVLSRREEYRKKKEKRIHTIRRTVPVLVCFCFTVVFVPMIWDNLAKLPDVPIHTDIVDEPTIDSSERAAADDIIESSSTDQAISADAVSTTIPDQNSESDIVVTAEKNKTQTFTTAVSSEKSGRETEQKTAVHRETQAPVTTAAVVIETKPIMEVQTTPPVQTTAETPKTIVNETKPIITEITQLPDFEPEQTGDCSPAQPFPSGQEPVGSPLEPVTTEATKPSDIVQRPGNSSVQPVTTEATKPPDIVQETVNSYVQPVTTEITKLPDIVQEPVNSPVQPVTTETSKPPDIDQDVQEPVALSSQPIPFDHTNKYSYKYKYEVILWTTP